jgi:hypothetical protein
MRVSVGSPLTDAGAGVAGEVARAADVADGNGFAGADAVTAAQ